ncbi:MAG: hypothetical protein ABR520_00925 [Mycobacteriales bacterium]|nr:hypothetical protein [Frankia sp.]
MANACSARVLRRLLVAATVPLLVTAVGCAKEKEERELRAASQKSCDGLLKPANTAAALPSDLPAGASGATFYETEKQGATTLYYAYVAGDDLVRTRDAIKSAFESAGYEIEGTDQENGAEAEFEWKGKAKEGSVQVIHLCKNNLRLRWRVGRE